MSYLNSEIILLGITQKQGSGQNWQKLSSSFCSAAKGLSLSCSNTVGDGEMVGAAACICECSNAFVNRITSSLVSAYLATVKMLASVYQSHSTCTSKNTPEHTRGIVSDLSLVKHTHRQAKNTLLCIL